MKRAVLDTSAFVAAFEERFDTAALPEESTISVVTIGELNHGVLAASDAKRPRRLRSLGIAQREFDALPVITRDKGFKVFDGVDVVFV